MIQIPGLENYFGGKGSSGTYQKIINQFPPHDIYIEPFLGAGNIFRRKKAASRLNWGMDMNEKLIKFYDPVNLLDKYKIGPGCALAMLNSFAAGILKYNDRVLIYLDPPYLLTTRKSNTRYKFELNEKQHIEILTAVTNINNDVDHNDIYIVISSYQNDLYNEYLKDWRRIDFNSSTRGGVAVESLYMNYTEPTELHQYNFLGDDFREREKIQNQIKRNVERLERMNPILRNAILTNIKERFL